MREKEWDPEEGVHLRLELGHKKQDDRKEGRMRGDRHRRLHQLGDVAHRHSSFSVK